MYNCYIKTILSTIKCVVVLVYCETAYLIFFLNLFSQRQKTLSCKCSIVYEMQFQIEEDPACLCFSFFPEKRVLSTNNPLVEYNYVKTVALNDL